MKATTLFLFFLLFSISAIAQEMSAIKDTVPKVHKNVIKFLPVNLAFNSTSFEYERKFSAKNSFILGVGIPSEKSFINKFSSNADPNDFRDDLLSTMAVRAAFRHYTGHHTQAAGFYISPYLKYQTFSMSGKSSQTTDLGINFSEDIKMDGNTMSAGLQFGAQLMIAKRVCIDFYFLGIEAGLANFDAKVTSSNPDQTVMNEMKKNVDDFINDLPTFIGDKLTTSQTGSTIGLKGSSLPFPWYRGGISIGFAF
jgi:hypothetical protein